jgi:hypothetical protein
VKKIPPNRGKKKVNAFFPTFRQKRCCSLIPKKTTQMFGLFKKDPIAKLEKEYQKIMEEAMHVQRSGDLKAYAKKIEASERILDQIKELKQK